MGSPFGAVFSIATTRSGCVAPGRGFNSRERNQLKIVVFAPIPTAIVRIATSATVGALRIVRSAVQCTHSGTCRYSDDRSWYWRQVPLWVHCELSVARCECL